MHIHTPSSFDYRGEKDELTGVHKVTDEKIVTKLIENNIKLAVIADHHVMDIDRFLNLKKLGKGKINFLLGIEIRTKATKLHYYGHFY